MKLHNWILVILIMDCSNAVPLSGFMPFGQSSGDLSFSEVYLAASGTFKISPSIPYFNETYSEISVSQVSYLCTCVK